MVQRQEQLTSGLEGEGIQVRGERRSASQAVNALSHQFTLEDRLPLKNGKPPMESILRKEISCRVTDCKLAQGQLAVSGRADISFLYLSSVDGSLEKMAASVEFSQVIECAGASEDCLCDLRVVAGESSLQPREDDVGEYTSVDVSLKVFLTAFLYQPCEVELVSDAFSTQAPMDLRFAQSSLLAVQEVYSEVLKKKCTLTATEEEIQKVVDLWCEQEGVQSTCGEGKLSYRVRYTLCLLYRGTSGRLLYLEKSFEGTFATELEHRRGLCGDVGVQPALQPGERVLPVLGGHGGERPALSPPAPAAGVLRLPRGEAVGHRQKPPGAALGFAGAERPVRGYAAGRPAPDNLQPIKHTAVER